MYNGKMKAVTFSFDDGITQDCRLIDILGKYGLKCTFNLNSGLLGPAGSLYQEEVTVAHLKPRPCEVRAIYEGHEIAAHTLTRPNLIELDGEAVIREVEQDRLALSEPAAYEFDVRNDRARFEEFCKLISGRSDIFYGTNKEVLL